MVEIAKEVDRGAPEPIAAIWIRQQKCKDLMNTIHGIKTE